MSDFKLEKWVWTEDNFEKMGWHDCRIHGFCVDEEKYQLFLDIDYIFEWVIQKNNKYKFWVAPATLVFENVYDLHFDLNCSVIGIEMFSLEKEEARKPFNSVTINKEIEWKWNFDIQEGCLSFWSVGFKQYIRRPPVLIDTHFFSLTQRGGISFLLGKEK